MMRYWSTGDLPPQDQFSYWREVLCQAFTPLDSDRSEAHKDTGPSEPGMSSWVRSARLTTVNAAEVSSRTQLITHGRREVARTSSEDLFVNLVIRGSSIVKQDGRSIEVTAGGFSIVDTTRTFEQEYREDPEHREWRVISYRVPRQELAPLVLDPMQLTATAHQSANSGIARVAISTMLSVWKDVEGFERPQADAAQSALTALVAAAAGGSHELRETNREVLDASLRATINRYLLTHLGGQIDLSATRVAAHFGISVRKLHQIYHDGGESYARTVRTFRLEACARELESGNVTSMTALAARWGFSDLSHLNRVFRNHYGCLPSSYRP
jgi:AraC-like DNA-binding protein